jgi:hypothetical protein
MDQEMGLYADKPDTTDYKKTEKKKNEFAKLPPNVIRLILGEFHILRVWVFTRELKVKSMHKTLFGYLKSDRLRHIFLIFRSLEFVYIDSTYTYICFGHSSSQQLYFKEATEFLFDEIPFHKLFFLDLTKFLVLVVDTQKKILKRLECLERLSGIKINPTACFDVKIWNPNLFKRLEFLSLLTFMLEAISYKCLNKFKKLRFLNISFYHFLKPIDTDIVCKRIESLAIIRPKISREDRLRLCDNIPFNFCKFPRLNWFRSMGIPLDVHLFNWIAKTSKCKRTVQICFPKMTCKKQANIVLPGTIKTLVLNNQNKKFANLKRGFVWFNNIRKLILWRFILNDENIDIIFNEENKFDKLELNLCKIVCDAKNHATNLVKKTKTSVLIIKNVFDHWGYGYIPDFEFREYIVTGIFRNKHIKNVRFECNESDTKMFNKLVIQEKFDEKKITYYIA